MAKSGQAGEKRGQEIRCNQRWEREEAKKGVILCCKRGSEHVRGLVAKKKFHVQREKLFPGIESELHYRSSILSFCFQMGKRWQFSGERKGGNEKLFTFPGRKTLQGAIYELSLCVLSFLRRIRRILHVQPWSIRKIDDTKKHQNLPPGHLPTFSIADIKTGFTFMLPSRPCSTHF